MLSHRTAEPEAPTTPSSPAGESTGGVVEFLTTFADDRRFWIAEPCMRLHIETWGLVEIYRKESDAAGTVADYLRNHPDSRAADRATLINRVREAHGWRAADGYGRRRVGRLIAQALKDERAAVRASSVSPIGRTRAATRVAERKRHTEQRRRLHERRITFLDDRDESGFDSSGRTSKDLLYADTRALVGPERLGYRHPAVLQAAAAPRHSLDSSLEHGLSQSDSSLGVRASFTSGWPVEEDEAGSRHLSSPLPALPSSAALRLSNSHSGIYTPANGEFPPSPSMELTVGQSPSASLHQRVDHREGSRIAQALLVHSVCATWEAEEADASVAAATQTLANSSKRARNSLRAALKAEHAALEATRSVGHSKRTAKEANRRSSREMLTVRSRLYSDVGTVNSVKRYQKKRDTPKKDQVQQKDETAEQKDGEPNDEEQAEEPQKDGEQAEVPQSEEPLQLQPVEQPLPHHVARLHTLLQSGEQRFRNWKNAELCAAQAEQAHIQAEIKHSAAVAQHAEGATDATAKQKSEAEAELQAALTAKEAAAEQVATAAAALSSAQQRAAAAEATMAVAKQSLADAEKEETSKASRAINYLERKSGLDLNGDGEIGLTEQQQHVLAAKEAIVAAQQEEDTAEAAAAEAAENAQAAEAVQAQREAEARAAVEAKVEAEGRALAAKEVLALAEEKVADAHKAASDAWRSRAETAKAEAERLTAAHELETVAADAAVEHHNAMSNMAAEAAKLHAEAEAKHAAAVQAHGEAATEATAAAKAKAQEELAAAAKAVEEASAAVKDAHAKSQAATGSVATAAAAMTVAREQHDLVSAEQPELQAAMEAAETAKEAAETADAAAAEASREADVVRARHLEQAKADAVADLTATSSEGAPPPSLFATAQLAEAGSVLIREGQLRHRLQSKEATPKRRRRSKRVRNSLGSPLKPGQIGSRSKRELLSLMAEGFTEADAVWALQRAGNGGAEEARKMLSVALPERPPQYEEKPGTPGGTPGGVSKAPEYIPSASLETEYWRRASNRGATSQLTLTAPPTPV